MYAESRNLLILEEMCQMIIVEFVSCSACDLPNLTGAGRPHVRLG